MVVFGLILNLYVPRLHAMIKHTPDALCTKWIEREPLEEWSDETGRLVLMGDAAHPAMVCKSSCLPLYGSSNAITASPQTHIVPVLRWKMP